MSTPYTLDQYLKDRFGYTFTGTPAMASLEEYIRRQGRQVLAVASHAKKVERRFSDLLAAVTGSPVTPASDEVGLLRRQLDEAHRETSEWRATAAGRGQALEQLAQENDGISAERERLHKENIKIRDENIQVRKQISVLAAQRIELEQAKMEQADALAGALRDAEHFASSRDAHARELEQVCQELARAAEQTGKLRVELDRRVREQAVQADRLKSWMEKSERLERELEGAKGSVEDLASQVEDLGRSLKECERQRNEALERAMEQQLRADEADEKIQELEGKLAR